MAPDPFLGAGPGVVVRGRAGLGLGGGAALGLQAGEPAARGEALLTFSLDPLRERGVAPYATGGVAVLGARGGTHAYLVAALGLSLNPGAKRGWFAEAGVGGGVRLSVGVVFRRFRR